MRAVNRVFAWMRAYVYARVPNALAIKTMIKSVFLEIIDIFWNVPHFVCTFSGTPKHAKPNTHDTHIHTYTHMHIHTHTRTHTYTHTYTHAHTHTHTRHTHIHTHSHTGALSVRAIKPLKPLGLLWSHVWLVRKRSSPPSR